MNTDLPTSTHLHICTSAHNNTQQNTTTRNLLSGETREQKKHNNFKVRTEKTQNKNILKTQNKNILKSKNTKKNQSKIELSHNGVFWDISKYVPGCN